MDLVKEDIKVVIPNDNEAEKKVRPKRMIFSGNPQRKQMKSKDKIRSLG